jgi:hypothetical protein
MPDAGGGPSTGPAGGALTGSYPNPQLNAPEAWHGVGTAEAPWAVDVGFPGYAWGPDWSWNANTPGFFKDPWGVVHIRGMVKCTGAQCGAGSVIFKLPRAIARRAGTCSRRSARAPTRTRPRSRASTWTRTAG